jgi:hypothetical protein
METIVDRISNIAVSTGILRVECVGVNAIGQDKPSGTVLVPGSVAGQWVQSLAACRTESLRLNAEDDFAVAGFRLALDRTLIPV